MVSRTPRDIRPYTFLMIPVFNLIDMNQYPFEYIN